MLGDSFQQFSLEAFLASASIRGGLTALNKCKIHDKGSFYNTFFQLSVGLERFFKIIYIVQYMVENKLQKPSPKELRRVGHDIKQLHSHAVFVARSYENLKEHSWDLNDVQLDILSMLSDFGKETRYYNLNTIVADKKEIDDPLCQWNWILEDCYLKFFSEKKRKEQLDKACMYAPKNSLYGFTSETGLDGDFMTYIDKYILNLKIIKVSPFIAFEIINMLRPYYSLLKVLRCEIHLKQQEQGITEPILPYLHEVFPYFLLERSSAIKRRNWLY